LGWSSRNSPDEAEGSVSVAVSPTADRAPGDPLVVISDEVIRYPLEPTSATVCVVEEEPRAVLL
jgi:hypothetical protein